MKKTIYFILVILLSSCFVFKKNIIRNKDVVGEYNGSVYGKRDIGKYNPFGFQPSLKIYKDNTFLYEWTSPHIPIDKKFGKTTGKWTIIGDSLEMNSDLQPSFNPKKSNYSLLEKSENISDSLRIEIIDDDNQIVPFAPCVLMSNSIVKASSRTNGIGVASLPRISADSLIILAYNSEIRMKAEKGISYYKFRIIQYTSDYVYFTNNKFVLSNDSLIGRYPLDSNLLLIFNKNLTEKH